MHLTRYMTLALILLTSACASNRGEWKPPPAPNEPIRGGVVEFQVTSYDWSILLSPLRSSPLDVHRKKVTPPLGLERVSDNA